METTRDRVQQSIKSRRVGDALHREASNILRIEEAKLDALDGRRRGLMRVHSGDRKAGLHLLSQAMRAQKRAVTAAARTLRGVFFGATSTVGISWR
jgi:hypothetical protein